MAWRMCTEQLKATSVVAKWTLEQRQEAWTNGHSMVTRSNNEYAERREQLKAEKIRKKAEEATVEVTDLIDLAGQVDITMDPRDIE